MLKKIGMLCGVFVLMLIIWIAACMWFGEMYGTAGFSGALVIGFFAVPPVLWFTSNKLFKAGEKKPLDM
ncbi:hypothetical protein ACFQI7_10510 [Paenibacillus allorhizosphaerae]|uniref:hypothetical protein n=1 Tax=Paenibacillus allorhizosphaerae TaxID=2849866 RepID=UPI001C4064EA|nr:hypothetical protein [Paenibacillus allorhizosphaerae]